VTVGLGDWQIQMFAKCFMNETFELIFLKSVITDGFAFFIEEKDSTVLKLRTVEGKIRNTLLLFLSHKVAGTRSLVLPYRKEKIQLPSI